jgi:chemotaxis-related protein WspB
MMLLMFKVNNDRYGIDVIDVVEVVPCVPLQKLPKSPPNIAGLLNYRGSVIPVIDSSRLLGDSAVKPCLSSRIIMVRSDRMKSCCIGLLAENVTETLKIDNDKFTDASIGEGVCALVDKVVLDGMGMIQHIDTALLIPEELKSFMKSIDTAGVESGEAVDGS